jgi:predicted nucleic acid-binding protein
MSTASQPNSPELFFLDTNIFVYALLASEPLKKQRALQLIEQALASHQGCTSYQVIQEFANVATRKFAQRFNTDQCKQFIDAAMQPMNRVSSSPELLNSALDLQQETHYSFYDCLVLAAALQVGADVLYSEDLQHNQLVGGTLRIVNPFLMVANDAPL